MIMTIVGQLQTSSSWVRYNWERMIQAHNTPEPEALDQTYYPDIFEIKVTKVNETTKDHWAPPNDDDYRLTAYAVGYARGGKYDDGSDFLCKGNYIHPRMEVVSVNGMPIKGKVYCPGSATSFMYRGIPGDIKRSNLCVLAPYNIRKKTALKTGDTVELTIECKELSSET